MSIVVSSNYSASGTNYSYQSDDGDLISGFRPIGQAVEEHDHTTTRGLGPQDDRVFSFGTTRDLAIVHISAGLAANTALTNAIIGTPVVATIPADTTVISHKTASGDLVFLANDGAGNSWEYFRFDTSADILVFNEASSDIDFRFEGNGNANLLVLDAGTDSIGLGDASNPTTMIHVNAAFTPTSGAGSILYMPADITGLADNNVHLIRLANTTIVEAGSGTHTRISALDITAPTITDNAGGTTDTATVYISGAMSTTVSGRNKALWVDAGVSEFGGNITPDVSDGAALGTTTLMWSDVMLASGAVINFDAGNDTLTHTSGTLTHSGAWVNTGDLAVNGGDLTSTATTFNLLDTTVTTLNLARAAGAVNTGTTVTGGLLWTFGNLSTSTVFQINSLGASGFVAFDLAVEGGTADFDTRIIRATGANGAFNINNRGTGSIIFQTNLTTAFTIASGGNGTLVGDLTVSGGNVALGVATSQLGTLQFNGNTSGTITMNSAAAAGTWTFTLPPDDGDAGEQLQTNGSGVTTWEAASSRSAVKNFVGVLDPMEALRRIVAHPIRTWHYKPEVQRVGGDYASLFAGPVAEDDPWAMKHGGNIFNEINAAGHAFAAIQALEQENHSLRERVALLEAR